MSPKAKPVPVVVSDLPVRKVQIFNRQLVLPKDTLCEAALGYYLTVNRYGSLEQVRSEAEFKVFAEVKLFHSHLPGREKKIFFTVYEEETKNSRWLENRIMDFPNRGWGFRDTTQKAILRQVKWAGAVEAMNDMFLAGDINLKGLKPYLPQKKCFG